MRQAIEETREKVRIILSMHNNGFTAEQIASAGNRDIEEIYKTLTTETHVGKWFTFCNVHGNIKLKIRKFFETTIQSAQYSVTNN